MKFEDLEISHFRGIDTARLEGIKQVNLITGRNNSGKTSILEAMFVLSGMSNPRLLLNINAFRKLKFDNDNNLKYIFNNVELNEPIKLQGTISGIVRSATITPHTEMMQDILLKNKDLPHFFDQRAATNPSMQVTDLLQLEQSSLQNKIEEIDGINISFKNNSDKEQKVYINFKDGRIKYSNTYKEKLSTKYLDSQITLTDVGSDLSLVVKKKQIKNIVDILKRIEPHLLDIQIANDNSIYCDIGKDELLPINIMGDGIRHTLAVLSAMYDMQNGVIFIDEVENGLHYSSIKIFWQAVLRLADELDVQIVATTHSYEAVKALKEASKMLPGKNPYKEIAFFRIEKEDSKTTVIHYDYETFITSLDEGYEVR